MKKRIVILLFLISFVCISLVAINRFSVLSAKCILPDIAKIPADMYKVHPKRETSFFTDRETIIPFSWNIQPNWLQPFQIKIGSSAFINAIAARNGTVWIGFLSQILRYNNATGASNLYQLSDENQEAFVIRDIFFTQDGNLWALVATNKKSNSVAVARYNPHNDRFEVVPKLFDKKDEGDIFFRTPHILAETTDGKLLVPLAKNIVLYDIRQNIARRLLPQDFSMYVAGMAVSGNKVWFTVGRFEINVKDQDMDLRSVDLQTGEIVNYGHILGMLDNPDWRFSNKESYRSLAVDGQENVWMGSFAQLRLGQDGKYNWQKIVPPPEFVYETVVNPYEDNEDNYHYAYEWAGVYGVDHYSDGNIWFDSTIGLVQYNPKTNTWCKSITTGWDNPVFTDDRQGNLWMAIIQDSHSNDPYLNIYKYKLTP